MRKLICGLLAAATLALTGCGYEIIPPAHRGKILSGSGYSDEVYSPGREVVAAWKDMILLDMSTNIKVVPYELFMADKLQLKGDVAIRASIRDDNVDLINKMFDDIKLDVGNGDKTLDFDRVWAVYAQTVVSNEIRNVLSKTNWDEISADYDKYGALIRDRINERLNNTPIKVGDVNLGKITPPEAISKKFEEIERKIMELAQEDANFAIDDKKNANALSLAISQGLVDQKNADNAAAVNNTLSASVTPELLQLRNIEMLQNMSPNANMVVLPYESLGSPGLQGKVYR